MMTNNPSMLRKAAVLLRSLDADMAAAMLAQLSLEEAASIRTAIRALGPIDPEEQAEVLAEFRRARTPLIERPSRAGGGVELALSSPSHVDDYSAAARAIAADGDAKRFEFLASAPTSALVPYLAREHAQTIAVVLAHLEPSRAAAVLSELPQKLQADTIERLSAMGETDPESVTALEHELAAWMAKRGGGRAAGARRRETVANILAAVDPNTRRGMLNNLRTHKVALAEQIAPLYELRGMADDSPTTQLRSEHKKDLRPTTGRETLAHEGAPSRPRPQVPRRDSLPQIDFDELVHLDSNVLTAVLRELDAKVLSLALAGSQDELVDRICAQMPKQTARAFRRELRRMGPTRLSDVEMAQRAVAAAAARQLVQRRKEFAAAYC